MRIVIEVEGNEDMVPVLACMIEDEGSDFAQKAAEWGLTIGAVAVE